MVDYGRYKLIKVEKREKVATLTLNQPDKLNAVGEDFHDELEDIFVDVDKDDEVNAVILTGEGRAFSAGGDIQYMIDAYKNPSMRMQMSHVKKLLENFPECKKKTTRMNQSYDQKE